MKRTLLIILGISLICSCTTIRWQMGMSEKDFTAQSRQISNVEMTTESSIYKFNAYGGITKFFYFVNGKLVKVDEGVDKPDIIIQHTN